MASVIAANGPDAAAEWAQRLVANFARRPQGNDRAQAKAVFEGQCDVVIMNHYYFGKMLYGDKPEQREWADAIRLVFTNQDGRGNHVNISGGGMAKHSLNPDAARGFLEFLTMPTAQQLYGEVNFEYPVNPDVAPGGVLSSWGDFKRDDLAIERLAEPLPTPRRLSIGSDGSHFPVLLVRTTDPPLRWLVGRRDHCVSDHARAHPCLVADSAWRQQGAVEPSCGDGDPALRRQHAAADGRCRCAGGAVRRQHGMGHYPLRLPGKADFRVASASPGGNTRLYHRLHLYRLFSNMPVRFSRCQTCRLAPPSDYWFPEIDRSAGP